MQPIHTDENGKPYIKGWEPNEKRILTKFVPDLMRLMSTNEELQELLFTKNEEENQELFITVRNNILELFSFPEGDEETSTDQSSAGTVVKTKLNILNKTVSKENVANKSEVDNKAR